MRQIGDTQPTSEIENVHLRGFLDTELRDDIAEQAEQAARGDLEAGHVEDLRADMAVQADQAQVLGGEDPADRFHRGAAGQ